MPLPVDRGKGHLINSLRVGHIIETSDIYLYMKHFCNFALELHTQSPMSEVIFVPILMRNEGEY